MADIARSAIDFRSFEPYYVQLKRILLKDLEADGAEGNLLPSEAGLCAQYSVSRTVVRQALAELEKEGLVLKVKGKGTFVTGRGVDTRLIQETLGFYESLSQAGHVVQSQVLKAGHRAVRRRCGPAPRGRRRRPGHPLRPGPEPGQPARPGGPGIYAGPALPWPGQPGHVGPVALPGVT